MVPQKSNTFVELLSCRTSRTKNIGEVEKIAEKPDTSVPGGDAVKKKTTGMLRCCEVPTHSGGKASFRRWRNLTSK
jgi:hypothetical protein